ncbi:MAG TPA: hypothetical protein VMW27_03770, partial [Thermoanaerobaculia bacterium]|nr:hypothetical protein [Thermoanaerobaculia bacterium]
DGLPASSQGGKQMRKLLLCLTLVGAGLSLETAQAQPKPFCAAYCCATPTAISSSPCWISQENPTTCGWYWLHYGHCP